MAKPLLAVFVSCLWMEQTAASYIPMDLSRSCSAGDTFGLFDRESGCGIGNCDCLSVLFECDPSLANQLGQCVLTGNGVALAVLAALGSVLVPLFFVLRHIIRDKSIDENVLDLSVLRKEAPSKRATLTREMTEQLQLDDAPDGVHSPRNESQRDASFFDMAQFRANVPAKVIGGSDRRPTIMLETMSKGWINFMFLFLIASTLICLVIFVLPVLVETADLSQPIDTIQFINTSAYRMQVAIDTTTVPRGTRYLSILGDVCPHADRSAFPPHGRLNLSYDMAFYVDSKPYFESFVGFMIVQCECPSDNSSACFLSSAYDSAHALTLVSMPWYKDQFNWLSNPDPHTFTFNATLDLHTLSNATFNNITLRSSYSTAYPVVDDATYVFTALDVLILLYWLVVHRMTPWRDWLPARRAVLVLLSTNVLTTSSIMHLFHLFLHSSAAYLATQAWLVTFHAAWLLCILVLIDMQRHGAFYHFHIVPAAVVVAVTLRHLSFFYFSATATSLVDLSLSIASLWVFRSVVVSTLHSLRHRHYAATRASQLTATVLHVISFIVPYIYMIAAVTADPSPVVHTFLSTNSALTTLPTQIIIRVATLVLVLLFLPPSSTSSSHLHNVAGNAMAVLATRTTDTATAPRDASTALSATSIFSIETACALYNLSNHAYSAPPSQAAPTTQANDEKPMDIVALNRDQVRLLDSLLDVTTDTHGTVFLDHINHRLIVAFRGTASTTNAVTDVKIHAAAPTHWTTGTAADDECADIRLHAGFWEAYCSIRDQLHTALAAHTDKPWVFTGHSLGGALATIAAFDASRTFKTHVTMYNYGSPRVGNHAFAKVFPRHVTGFRIVNDGDIVVGGPKFAVAFLGGRVAPLIYKHVGTAVLLSERAHGTFIVDPNIVEKALIAQLRGFVTSHVCSAYKLRLQKGLRVAIEDKLSKPLKKAKASDMESAAYG
ncbi:Aste57867_6525 [Aphanomyces stellatus]|uniref:Aste57867_6525 protein n=1 Tax=Aphanomyces stellatus TaxID=120398 RepID=A0A485KHV0_9STRA|nr:hypothetical protein As57867_006508 [Aphanomyces stellatus]VFT83507.1 Aste57867_6525 [Aphanomyces stellatus]